MNGTALRDIVVLQMHAMRAYAFVVVRPAAARNDVYRLVNDDADSKDLCCGGETADQPAGLVAVECAQFHRDVDARLRRSVHTLNDPGECTEGD